MSYWDDHPEAIERLTVLWNEGHGTAEIGRRMGISKNAAIGKARRLGLEDRPSPIIRTGEPSARSVQRRKNAQVQAARKPTLPPLPSAQAAPKPVPVAPVAKPPEAPRAAVRPSVGGLTCQWPIGTPGQPGFRFCGDPAMAGRPYCWDHWDIGHVRVRDTRGDAGG